MWGKSRKTNTSCMLNNPLSQPSSLITNYSEYLLKIFHWTTQHGEIGLNSNKLYKLHSHSLIHIISTQQNHLSHKAWRWIQLPLLFWEKRTAVVTFCQRRLHSQTKQPCNLVSHFNQVTDKQSISPDLSDNIEVKHAAPTLLQIIPPLQILDFCSTRDTEVLPRPCTGYKQATDTSKQSSCLFNKWLLPWLQ